MGPQNAWLFLWLPLLIHLCLCFLKGVFQPGTPPYFSSSSLKWHLDKVPLPLPLFCKGLSTGHRFMRMLIAKSFLVSLLLGRLAHHSLSSPGFPDDSWESASCRCHCASFIEQLIRPSHRPPLSPRPLASNGRNMNSI